jgi:UDP-N-acetylglucosamine--N-acetylmuramyl-(pentapeptide) pyrophosphoryl-undecaprenol N-acetylglucosamine transferase
VSAAGRGCWVVAGGGTGGHVTPALALAERIAERGHPVLVLGGQRGLEARLVPAAGFELVTLPARQMMGRSLARRLAALPVLARACASAWRVLGRRRAQIVLSVGGYASVPAVVAGLLRRLPVALVEPNAVPGRANLAAARRARRIFVGFEATAERFARRVGRDRVEVTGVPLRRALVQAFAQPGPRRTPAPPLRLLIFGGSQGAHQINQALCEIAPRLDPEQVELFHQTGEADRDAVAAAYAAAGLRAEVVAFESDMPARYRWADLALCRAGALTVAELALAGCPALLVPYPFAADDHQTANARALAEVGAARVLDGRSLSSEALHQALAELLADPARISEMAARASALARPRAAERIVEACASLLPGSSGGTA